MVLPTGLLLASWCVMTTTHECGHLIGGWLGGATLVEADLWPWHLPQSMHAPDPHPLLTLWSGPLLGVLIPCTIAMLLRRNWMWLFANFCLLANGLYLALAWLSGDNLLDTARLLHAGTPPATIAAFCAVTIPLGYWRLRANILTVLCSRPPHMTPDQTI